MPILPLLLVLASLPSGRGPLLARAQKGEVRAEVQLALSLQDPVQGPVDLKASEHWLRVAAATGDSEGEFYLGRLLHLVPHAHHDGVEARLWYQKAAAQGNKWALNNLGLLAEDSDDRLERAKAIDYFRQAAEAGELHGEQNMARCCHEGDWVQQDDAQARIWYAKAAAQGDGESEAELGSMYWEGEGGPKDFAQARVHLEQAAALKNAWGTVNLGTLNELGIGQPVNPVAAAHLYEEAIRLGNARALDRLGSLYARGVGVPQDPVRARELFLEAIQKGVLHAWSSLGVLHMDGAGVPKSDSEAVRYFFMGAYLGEPQCENNVGAFYHHGRGGLNRDLVNAYAWFKIADAAGDPTAKGNLASVDREISMLQRVRGDLLIPDIQADIRRRRSLARLD